MPTAQTHTKKFVVPSKFDIIPIHVSDIGNFKRCRRYWSWSSPTRNNLRHRVEIYGVNVPLWFGTGIHYALEKFYDPVLKRDPVESWQTWFTYQWEGGIVTDEWLERTYDMKPVQMPNKTWAIQGLRDMLPMADEEEYAGYRELGIGMMTFYKEYAAKHDEFEVIAAESTFSIPILDPTTGEVMRAIDIREHSPNYGKELEVHARGKRDCIVQSLRTEKYLIMDHKTAAKVDEDYFLKLAKDEQVSNYHWASEAEARMYGLPYLKIDGVIYNVLRKAFPRPPTITTRGLPSLNRQEESTTADMFLDCVKELGLQQWAELDAKAKSYYEWLLDQGEKNFIIREVIRRNQYEVQATERNIALVAKDMISDPAIYPTPTGQTNCIKCAFRAPCIAIDDGSDWKDMLLNGYEKNPDR